MTDPSAMPEDKSTISCDFCLKEVPLSAAFTPEGADYVGHFCGIDCYEKFVAAMKRLDDAGPGRPA